jgi:hypothetical protein
MAKIWVNVDIAVEGIEPHELDKAILLDILHTVEKRDLLDYFAVRDIVDTHDGPSDSIIDHIRDTSTKS